MRFPITVLAIALLVCMVASHLMASNFVNEFLFASKIGESQSLLVVDYHRHLPSFSDANTGVQSAPSRLTGSLQSVRSQRCNTQISDLKKSRHPRRAVSG
jgi:hypothetical protein